jgi:hypothetical protein
MGCKTCGGGIAPDQVMIVERMDGSTFEVATATDARIKIALGEGKKYYAKKKDK